MFCSGVYKVRQEERRHDYLSKSLKLALKLICGKMDNSDVKECEFNVGDSLKNCKAGVVFDFHKIDTPNPCDNKKLIKRYHEWEPHGSCGTYSVFI